MTSPFEMLPVAPEAETFRRAGFWKDRLLIDYLDEAVRATPQKLAMVDAAGERTYQELADRVQELASGLLGLGVEPGDVVAVQLPNGFEWIVAHLAIQRVGAVTNPLVPIYRDREVGYMVQRARAKTIIVQDQFRGFDYVSMVDRLSARLPELENRIVLGSARGARGWITWGDVLDAGQRASVAAEEWARRRPDADDLALIKFTSGTTGSPKGVMHSHNTVLAGALPWDGNLGMDSSAVIHMASTFAHLTGYLYGVALPLMLGATAVYQQVWKAAEFIELVERYGIQHTSGATPFLQDLINAENLEDHDLSSLVRFCCMGAPIPRVVAHLAQERLPDLKVFGGWGQTECGLVTMGSPEDPEAKVLDSDGRVLPGMDLRIVDPQGDVVECGREGLIQVKGAFLFRGYLGMLDQTREEFENGWFNTGDLGTQDLEGYVRLSGRTKDIIVRGGENVPVSYVENILYEHPRIAAVALVGVPHPRLQEIGGVVVQLADSGSFDMDEMRRFLESKGVAKPYWPELLKVVNDFPRTPSGKIQKFRIRQQLSEEFGREFEAAKPALADA